jgi:hypothetical protein
MNGLRVAANYFFAALILLLLMQAVVRAGENNGKPSTSKFVPSELSTDCIDREYRGRSAKLGLDYTDLVNHCGQAVVITWQEFDDGSPQTGEGGAGQSGCIQPGGTVTTPARHTQGTVSENLPVSVVTCQ